MNQTHNTTSVVGEFQVAAVEGAELGALRRNQRRLLYGGGGLLTLLIVLTTLGSCLYGIDVYRSEQKDVFQEGRSAIDTFLIQRGIGQASSLSANDALWSTRQAYLIETGTPLVKPFVDHGEQLFIKSYSTAVPWLVLGHDTAALPGASLAAYLGMVSEYSSYTASTVSAMQSLVPITAYGYDPTGSLLAITGIKDEAQLLHALNVPDRRLALAKLRLLERVGKRAFPAMPARRANVMGASSSTLHEIRLPMSLPLLKISAWKSTASFIFGVSFSNR